MSTRDGKPYRSQKEYQDEADALTRSWLAASHELWERSYKTEQEALLARVPVIKMHRRIVAAHWRREHEIDPVHARRLWKSSLDRECAKAQKLWLRALRAA